MRLQCTSIMQAGLIFIILLLRALPFSYAASLSEEEIGARVRKVAKTLRCAVCQSESVWESNAPLAAQMRDLIRERVVAGESDEQIRAYFLSRYGDFILLEPRVRGLNRLLWFGPFGLLLLVGILLYGKLRRWTAVTHAPPQPLSAEEQRQVDATLKIYSDPG